MSHDNRQQVRRVFMEVADIPEADRAAALKRLCNGDSALRVEVEALLRAEQQAGGFMGNPTAQRAGASPPPASAATIASPLREGPGSRIGPYKLLQTIGEGGFGVVFMAEQEKPVVRRVALKIIKLGMDTRQVIARFEAERQALAMMDHTNIARVLDAGATETGRPYFVMELVKGVPITEYCDTANLSTAERLALFVPVCHAVQHAHQKGIIHRDIKPSNVLITLHDGVPVPKVIDFGIAKATQGRLTDKTIFTEYRQMIGTPEYMSPEQAEMSGLDIDTRSDIYSLGVLLYQLLTGVTPFDGKQLRSAAYGEIQRILREVDPPKPSTRISTLGETLATTAAHRRVEPRRLSAVIKGDLDWIVMKAMEKDRTRRYETANGLASDVQRHLGGEPVLAAPPSAFYRARKFIVKHRAPMAAAGLVGAALLVGLVATGMMLFRAVSAEGKLRDQNAVVIEERNRAQQAEKDARSEREKAESERIRAQHLYAEGLISNGDALVTSGEYRNAHAKFAEARAELERLGDSLERLDLSLVRMLRFSPPPLWSVELGEGVSTRWTFVRSRNEVICSRSDKKLYAIDLVTGEQTRTLGDSGDVRAITSTDGPDGPALIIGGLELTQVRDVLTGKLLRQAPDDGASRGGVASPDGQRVASINQRQKIVFWNARTMEIFGRDQDRQWFRCLAVSDDGSLVAAADSDGNIPVWDFVTGKRLPTIKLPEGAQGGYSSVNRGVASLAFSHDGKSLLVGESDGKVVSVTLDSNATVLARPHDTNIDSVSLTPQGDRIITTANDGEIRVLEHDGAGWTRSLSLADSQPGSFFGFFIPGTGAMRCEATPGVCTEDQGVIVAMSARGVLSAWPLNAPRVRAGGLTAGLSSSADGLLFAGEGYDEKSKRRAEVREAATGRLLRTMAVTGGNVASTAVATDDRSFYAGCDGVVWRVDLLKNKTDWAVQAHDNYQVWAIAASPDGQRVATVSTSEGVARVWDAATGQLLKSLPGQGDNMWSAAFVPRVGSPSDAGTIPPVSGDRLVVSSGSAPFISDWDLTSDKTPRRAPEFIVRSLTLSPDHRTLAVTGGANFIDLLDLESFRSVGKLGPIPTISYNFAFVSPTSRPGRWGLSNGRTDLRLWDVQNRKEVLVLLRNVGNQFAGCLVGTPDGAAALATGIGRIDFTLPRRIRELAAKPSAIGLAEVYARYGLWAWARIIIDREEQAGHSAPAILKARAAWMCGDYPTAKKAFAEAARKGEVPAAYAELCASVEDHPIEIKLSAPTARPPDAVPESAQPRALSAGVLDAADVDALRTKLDQEVVLEGVIAQCGWSGTGKSMSITFAGKAPGNDGALAVVFKAKREEFDKAFGGDVAAALSGARVQIRGKLGKYGGYVAKWADWPQIILDDPAQVTIQK